MGEGPDENVSELQVPIKPMSSVVPVTHNGIIYDPGELGHYLSNLLQNAYHSQPYKHCNKPHVVAQ